MLKPLKKAFILSLLLCLFFIYYFGPDWIFSQLHFTTPKLNCSHGANVSLDWRCNIDFVILWAGKPKLSLVTSNTTVNMTVDVARERYNDEFPYLLRSVAMHAPWVRKIFIIINTGVDPPDKKVIPNEIKNRTFVIDRCTYMPNGTCPSRNSHAIKAYTYLVPGLSERYVIGDDDIFFGRPVEPSHFFENKKPLVWRKKPTWGFFGGQEFHRVYEDPSVATFPTPMSAAPSPHFWYPQLKSVCESMHRQYPQFYAFVGSHSEGRYSSKAKGISDKENSQEECFVGTMMWEYLRTKKGVYKNIDKNRYTWWDEVEISDYGFKQAVKTKPIFMNVNDRFSTNDTIYKKQINWFHKAMDKLFPLEVNS